MLVYRVEHEEYGIGPYQIRHSGNVQKFLNRMGADHSAYGYKGDQHPMPAFDGIEDFDTDYDYCGFESMEALVKWFDGYLLGLARYGFVVRIYDVPDDEVQLGVKQLAFNKGYAEHIRTQSMCMAA